NYFNLKENTKVTLQIKRGTEVLQKEITPVLLKETNKGGIGVSLLESAVVSYPWYLAIYQGFLTAFIFTWEVIKAFALLIWGLVTGAGGMTQDLSGPIGIAVLTGKVAKLGFIYLLQFMAMLSINL
ncbi:MAG: site-2 protease family protein, partial [Candidatus Magasanikbacteria bacterium]|nr:site-2 protease family protein [Candidatus Magasanikbacteria bacterium]